MPARQLQQVLAVRAEAALQLARGRSAASSPIVVTPSLASCSSIFGPTPHSRRIGQRREEVGLGARGHDHEAVGLAHVGGDLGHELGGGDADGGGELRLAPDRVLEAPRDLLARPEGALAARDVEEGLVDGDGLHARP